MSLQSGAYQIISKANDKPVGRRFAEDRSLLPKNIAVLPEGDSEPWLVEKHGDDKYILRARGSYVANFDGQLLAALLEGDQDKTWLIQPQPHHGENVYTIVLANDPYLGWVVDTQDEENGEVYVRPVISTKSIPPQFPPNFLFQLIALQD